MKIPKIILHFVNGLLIFGALFVFAGCANFKAQKNRQSERSAKKELKRKEKAYAVLKKKHFEMQTEDTKRRIKMSERRLKQYHRHHEKNSFWKRLSDI